MVYLCRVCLKERKKMGMVCFMRHDVPICLSCYQTFYYRPRSFYLLHCHGWALYPYKNQVRSLLYQYKGCRDVVLAPIFLFYHVLVLRCRYKGYTLVPIPSYCQHRLERGFDHVPLLYAALKLPLVDLFEKVKEYKQSELKRNERAEMAKFIRLKKQAILPTTPILLIDDIITTGSSLRSAIAQLKKRTKQPIAFLCIAYTCRK